MRWFGIGARRSKRVVFHESITKSSSDTTPVGAAEGCDLLILICCEFEIAEDQKIAAFGSSYGLAIISTSRSSIVSGVGGGGCAGSALAQEGQSA
ncbi:hypothetical protein [Pseudomonas sp. TH31]|uniref:hypothetical protein n=1 Tax=Pseudomonas sp. TH31 TaxID=2796396 RepID=UPI0019120B90|nr:hypothetical protein [Pseudomonas sp. TH31]MBK5415727.1 hypothetical protein [Pseudomonas sp. TH31]